MNAGWPTRRLRYLVRRTAIRGHAGAELLSVYRNYGVVRKRGRTDNFNKPGEDLSTYQLVRPGDLVLNKMKTWQGSLGVSDYEGIVSPAYFVCAIHPGVSPRYLHHALRSRPLVSEYARRSQGIRPNQWDLPWEEFLNIRVPLPPVGIQREIADFLDRECARIDDLLAVLGAQLADLDCQRGAVVRDAIAALSARPLKYGYSVTDCKHRTPITHLAATP